nr:uncharacterized protein LOC113814543 [Penaeus vannamei]
MSAASLKMFGPVSYADLDADPALGEEEMREEDWASGWGHGRQSRPYSVRRASGAEPEDLLPDVLLVHDSYRDSDLHVTCFSQDPDFALEKNLVKWDYSKNMGHKKADIQKRRAVFTFDDGTQLPRPHMQGSARELTF